MVTELQRTDDCWSRIGVRGDRSCPLLQRHVHCRNCEIYSAGARMLLDAPLPEEFLSTATEHFAQPLALTRAQGAASRLLSAIVFRVGSEWLALPTMVCVEVADLRPIRSLPNHRNKAVLGLANVRGELRVCVCLGTILGVAEQQAETVVKRSIETKRLLVANVSSGAVVFPVDEILGVQRFQSSELRSAPAMVSRAQSYIKGLLGLGDRTVGLLDEAPLFRTVERGLA